MLVLWTLMQSSYSLYIVCSIWRCFQSIVPFCTNPTEVAKWSTINININVSSSTIIVITTWLIVSTAVQATAGLTTRRWILCLSCFYTGYLQRYSQGALLDFDRCWSVWMFTHVTDSIHCAWSSRLSTTTCDVTSQDASLRGTAQWAVPVKKER